VRMVKIRAIYNPNVCVVQECQKKGTRGKSGNESDIVKCVRYIQVFVSREKMRQNVLKIK
jgi:hypothetical protein